MLSNFLESVRPKLLDWIRALQKKENRQIDQMDLDLLALNGINKKVRKDKEGESDGCEDRLSDLPEGILCQILSFLPLRDAVMTSLLSTKWRYMWTLMTDLHFEDRCLQRKKKKEQLKFMNFFDRILRNHSKSLIQKFYFHCSHVYKGSLVKRWISDVIRLKNVKILDIAYGDESFDFPSCLFECKQLVELRLAMSCRLRIPADVCFTSLKVLELHRVALLANESTRFFLPCLEVLKLVNCVWCNLSILNVDAPVLKHFVMRYPMYRSLLDRTDVRRKSGNDSYRSCEVRVSGQCLASMEISFNTDLVPLFVLSNPSSVANLFIDVANKYSLAPERLPKAGWIAYMLLHQLSSVQVLTLSDIIIKALAQSLELKNLPTFEKLTHLKLSSSIQINTALSLFLQTSPNLKSLTFAGKVQEPADSRCPWKPLPSCVVCSLKFIKFGAFYAEEHEIRLTKFLLEEANVLEEVHITFAKKLPREHNLKKQLLNLPKSSSSAKILFKRSY